MDKMVQFSIMCVLPQLEEKSFQHLLCLQTGQNFNVPQQMGISWVQKDMEKILHHLLPASQHVGLWVLLYEEFYI